MDNNYIQTKRKRIRYKFSTTVEDFQSKPEKRTFSFFYQIATFPEQDKNGIKKFHLRKYIFDDKFNFVNVEDYRLSIKDCKNFYKRYPLHKFKQYDVIDLDTITPPSNYDLQTAISPNLANNDDSSILDSMYSSVTDQPVDYRNLYRGRGTNGIFPPISDLTSGSLDQNVITDFSSFN